MGKHGSGGTAGGSVAGQYAEQIARMAGPVRKQYFSQLTEALKTGNIKNRIPIIQQMVEGGLHQGARSLEQAQGGIASLGPNVARSPFAKETLAATRGMAERAIASIPSEVINAQAMQAPENLTKASDLSMGLLGQAGMMQGQAQQAAAANQAQATATAGAGVGAAIGIIGAIALI